MRNSECIVRLSNRPDSICFFYDGVAKSNTKKAPKILYSSHLTLYLSPHEKEFNKTRISSSLFLSTGTYKQPLITFMLCRCYTKVKSWSKTAPFCRIYAFYENIAAQMLRTFRLTYQKIFIKFQNKKSNVSQF